MSRLCLDSLRPLRWVSLAFSFSFFFISTPLLPHGAGAFAQQLLHGPLNPKWPHLTATTSARNPGSIGGCMASYHGHHGQFKIEKNVNTILESWEAAASFGSSICIGSFCTTFLWNLGFVSCIWCYCAGVRSTSRQLLLPAAVRSRSSMSKPGHRARSHHGWWYMSYTPMPQYVSNLCFCLPPSLARWLTCSLSLSHSQALRYPTVDLTNYQYYHVLWCIIIYYHYIVDLAKSNQWFHHFQVPIISALPASRLALEVPWTVNPTIGGDLMASSIYPINTVLISCSQVWI